MKKKRKGRKKVEFWEIRYPKRQYSDESHDPADSNIYDLDEIKARLLAPIKKRREGARRLEQGELYKDVFPDEYAAVQAQAQALLDWVHTCKSTDKGEYYRKIVNDTETGLPDATGWFKKYTEYETHTCLKLREPGDIEIAAAQMDIWLDVWNISHKEVTEKFEKGLFKTIQTRNLFYYIAIEQKKLVDCPV